MSHLQQSKNSANDNALNQAICVETSYFHAKNVR